MGSEAVGDLIKNTDVEAVTIAGRNLEGGGKVGMHFAQRAGSRV